MIVTPSKGWLARLIREVAGPGELEALDPRDRSRLRDDTGISDADLLDILHARHVNELLPLALARYGIDADALDREQREVMHDLQRTCAHCGITRACRRLLDDDDVDTHRRVCPNAGTMAVLGE
ncbi:hypothetical protein [Azospirillum rugosum]|uniref:Ribosomal protein S27AE n=1 Tax=Azospirillum rugosum TaxID=416170 RepID=A0ABS4SV66_9PROT|nr:hypothetical protein [Azospirillum rugosum]MBP2296466.1 ribosomal protein S27AE [Azospirillum rugosum]MDQ0529987.1 ribosomal protein S27AE [Azospirillum rugosum]